MFNNFERKKGLLENFEEVIYAGDIERFSPDILILNGEEIASVDFVRFKVTFFDEKGKIAFKNEIKKSGLADFISKKIKIDEIPLNIAAVAAVDKNLDRVSEYYNSSLKDKNKLTHFVSKLIKSEKEQRLELLEKHRLKLKDKETNKSSKLKI